MGCWPSPSPRRVGTCPCRSSGESRADRRPAPLAPPPSSPPRSWPARPVGSSRPPSLRARVHLRLGFPNFGTPSTGFFAVERWLYAGQAGELGEGLDHGVGLGGRGAVRRVEHRRHPDTAGAEDVGGEAVADHGHPAGRQSETLEDDPEERRLGLPDDHGIEGTGRDDDRLDDGAAAGQELAVLDGQPRIDVRRDDPSRGGRRAGGHGQPLIGQIEVVADGDRRRRAPVLHVDDGVTGAGDGLLHLPRAHHEDARAAPALGDDLTDDLERRQHVLGHADAEGVQTLAQVAAGGSRVVGEKAEAAAGSMQRGQRLAGAGIEHVTVPDAAVEIEDEAGEPGERDGGHAGQSCSVRWKSAIASAYTPSVRSATLAHENLSSTRRRPASPMARAWAGSSSRRRMATASSSGRAGATWMPVLPSSTTSTIPPTADATTAVPHAIASRLMRPNGSYTEGHTKTAAWL